MHLWGGWLHSKRKRQREKDIKYGIEKSLTQAQRMHIFQIEIFPCNIEFICIIQPLSC